MERKKAYDIFLVASVIVFVLALMMCILSCYHSYQVQENLPEFDSFSIAGKPDVDDSFGWFPLNDDQLPFVCNLAGVPQVSQGGLDVYFYNNETNDMWLKLEVYDADNNLLGETGLIKPGEYVKTVPGSYTSGSDIEYKVLGYTYEYFSSGSVILSTTIQ